MANFKFNKDKILRQVSDNLTKRYEQAVRTVRCPEHGTIPRVTFKGKTGSNINWRIENICCEQLKKQVEVAIQKANR